MQSILDILGTVGFNWHVALANFFNFLIILFLLQKFFFGKIGKVIDTRKEIIEKGLNQARDSEILLAQAEETKSEIIKNARKEETSILNNAHSKGAELAASLVASAESDINAKHQALKKEEEHLAEKVENAFRKKAPSLVASMYAKTLQKEMTEDENNALIARMQV